MNTASIWQVVIWKIRCPSCICKNRRNVQSDVKLFKRFLTVATHYSTVIPKSVHPTRWLVLNILATADQRTSVSYMTNDYIINVHYKLEFRYIQNVLFHRQHQVFHHTWRHLVWQPLDKEISLSIPGALLGDFVRFKGLNTRVKRWRL